MSELRRLLEDGLPPGVYRWGSAANPDKARRDVQESGWNFVLLDTTGVGDKIGFLDACATAFDLPRWFGRNWDALADALQDLSWLRGDGYFIHLRDAGSAARGLGRDWATLLEVLQRTAQYWKAHGKAFVVLVDNVSELPPWI